MNNVIQYKAAASALDPSQALTAFFSCRACNLVSPDITDFNQIDNQSQSDVTELGFAATIHVDQGDVGRNGVIWRAPLKMRTPAA